MIFLLLTIIAIIVQGFYSMLEMAAVSFNKVRLQYFVGQGNRRAIWLSRLLNNPTLLFGSTLIGVNTTLQFGSECSRRFYAAMDLSPDLAPITQIFVVLIFAELAPMFAARRYAEHVCMLGIPLIYLSSILLRPVIWLIGGMTNLIGWMMGGDLRSPLTISRDELQKAVESREDVPDGDEDFETISSNIFTLRAKTVRDLMIPLLDVTMLSDEAIVKQLRSVIQGAEFPFVPLYHSRIENIVAVAYPRDLLRLSPDTRVRPHARPPWFITEKSSILDILTQFRQNSQSLAIVLSDEGIAVGVLTLDAVIDEIFGQRDEWISFDEYLPEKHHIVIEKTFPADTSISEINQTLPIHLPMDKGDTLEEVMKGLLGHEPDSNETVDMSNIELTFLEGKRILLRTK